MKIKILRAGARAAKELIRQKLMDITHKNTIDG